MKLWYEKETTPSDLADALETLAEEYSIQSEESADAVRLTFRIEESRSGSEIQTNESGVIIYCRSVQEALRGVAMVLGADSLSGDVLSETSPFPTLGLMIDCSRNAVLRPVYVKRWLRRMALAGYNVLMLYTEDVYNIPGEPRFGYLRGAYTRDEIREIDDYAHRLGIELIPCIQVLGHLEQILKWGGDYREITDTPKVLLAGEEKTYSLIRKMIEFWASAVRSRRIHIGMDEAEDIGRGRYLDIHGYEDAFRVLSAHLRRVCEICAASGLKPMIWSDMYFRLGSKNRGYYDRDTVIPEHAIKSIPEDLQLVYWDYYHTEKEFYRDWIQRHRKLAGDPVMASGIWCWRNFLYVHPTTVNTVLPCVQACLEEGLKEVIFTMWKDDGGEVDFGSTLAGVYYCAEAAHNNGCVDEARWEQRFRGGCRADLQANLVALQATPPSARPGEARARMLLWDDPLLRMYRRQLLLSEKDGDFDPVQYYGVLEERLAALGEASDEAADLPFVRQLVRTVSRKVAVTDALASAYADGNAAMLEKAQKDLPELIEEVDRLWRHHRRVWLSQNKAFGLEVLAIRYGGLTLRLEEIVERVRQFLAGELNAIEELEESPPPGSTGMAFYRHVATSSSIL